MGRLTDCRRDAAIGVGDAGYWEAEARAQGLVIVDDPGLTTTELVTVRGCDPVLLLDGRPPGQSREEAIAWGLCELHRRARGACDARRQIGRSVAVVQEVYAAD